MRRILLLTSGLFFTLLSVAQSEKYVKAMEPLVATVDTLRNPEAFIALANSFERIGNAEKTQWLPFYYASLCYVNAGNMYIQQQQTTKVDPLMDKAEALLTKAEEQEKNNSEIYCVKKMLNSCRMLVDPMNRFMTYGPQASAALETAKSLNPENPRTYLLEGIDKYFTPEEYGGSKTEAKKLFQLASEKLSAFKPASSIHPAWGSYQLQYFLSLP